MRKKILVLTSTFPRWIGDTNPPFVYELSKRLVNNFDVIVLTPHYKNAKTYEEMEGLKVFRYRYFISRFEKLAGGGAITEVLKNNKFYYLLVPFFIISQLIAALKLIARNKIDLVHAHWIIPQGVVAVILKKFASIPYIVTSHGGDIFGLQGTLLRTVKNFVLTNAKHITVVSTTIKKEILNINPSLNNKIETIPMGVDSTLFNPDKYDESIKEKFNISGPFLLYVGRLAEKKGVTYLIKAMPMILNQYPTSKLIIIGSGSLESELKTEVKNLNLNESVLFTGPIHNSELPKYYATADIFIGPSIQTKDGDTEGFGLTFVEAMMSGCITLGSNIGGIIDILPPENLFEPKNQKLISEYVIEQINNRPDKRIITNSVNKFSWNEVSKKYAEIINL